MMSVVVAWDGGTGTLNRLEFLSGVEVVLTWVGGGCVGTVIGGDDWICM